jgi:DNA-binding transcriptional LysR family regulator
VCALGGLQYRDASGGGQQVSKLLFIEVNTNKFQLLTQCRRRQCRRCYDRAATDQALTQCLRRKRTDEVGLCPTVGRLPCRDMQDGCGDLERRHPDVDVQLHLTDRPVILVEQRFDSQLRIGEPPAEWLMARLQTNTRGGRCARCQPSFSAPVRRAHSAGWRNAPSVACYCAPLSWRYCRGLNP